MILKCDLVEHYKKMIIHKDGDEWMTVSEIMTRCGRPRPTVIVALSTLEGFGVYEKRYIRGPPHNMRRVQYRPTRAVDLVERK